MIIINTMHADNRKMKNSINLVPSVTFCIILVTLGVLGNAMNQTKTYGNKKNIKPGETGE